jgi:iron complex outermembrane receptor protein
LLSLWVLQTVVMLAMPDSVRASEHGYESVEELDLRHLYDLIVDYAPDQAVETPARIRQQSSLAPANVSVITAQDIQHFGYQNLGEILRHVAGFSATSDLTHDNFGVRGIHPGARAGSRVVKFMIDGQPASFRPSSQNLIDDSFIPLPLIERIEIVKGPVSALYGADAFLGVVNVITRDSQDFRAKGQVLELGLSHAQSGDHGSQVQLAGGTLWDDWESTYGLGFGYQERGQLQLPATAPDYALHAAGQGGRVIAPERDRSEPAVLYTRTRYFMTDQQQLALSLHVQQFETDQPYSESLPLRATGHNHLALYNGFLRLDYTHQLNQDWLLRLSGRGWPAGFDLESHCAPSGAGWRGFSQRTPRHRIRQPDRRRHRRHQSGHPHPASANGKWRFVRSVERAVASPAAHDAELSRRSP